MKAKKIFSFLMCVVMIFSVMPVCASAESIEVTEYGTENINDNEWAENEILFLYTQTVENKADFCRENNVGSELSACGITYLKEIPADMAYDTEIKTNSDGTFTKSTLFLGYTNNDETVCCEKVSALSSAKDVSLNYYMHEDSISMPSEITSPHSVYNAYTKWWMEGSVHIPEAWSKYDTLGAGTVVAIVDSGMCVDNSEISRNIWSDANGNRGFNADTLSSDVSPATSHGSNVAGIIAAVAGNNPALVGVAPQAKIMPIKVSRTQSNIPASAVITGINYAIANGADIISMSLSTPSDIPEIRAVCAAAYNAGITVISSAGNNSVDTSVAKYYPAAYSFVISVMAYGSNNQLCSFSNFDSSHSYYDIAAPGDNILGLDGSNNPASLSNYSGTSQAAPIVAGLAALYFSIYPDHTPDEFKNALLNSSTETVTSNPAIVTNTTYTFPRVNALKLLGYYDCVEPVVEPLPGTPTVVSNVKGMIYGLEEGYGDIDDYVNVSNGSAEFIPTDIGNGTGSILRVYYPSGEFYSDYEIVIFGDTDGDAFCDGMDCALCQYVLDGGTDVTDGVRFACDVDFDNSVSQSDLDIITMCGLKKDFVAQIR